MLLELSLHWRCRWISLLSGQNLVLASTEFYRRSKKLSSSRVINDYLIIFTRRPISLTPIRINGVWPLCKSISANYMFCELRVFRQCLSGQNLVCQRSSYYDYEFLAWRQDAVDRACLSDATCLLTFLCRFKHLLRLIDLFDGSQSHTRPIQMGLISAFFGVPIWKFLTKINGTKRTQILAAFSGRQF